MLDRKSEDLFVQEYTYGQMSLGLLCWPKWTRQLVRREDVISDFCGTRGHLHRILLSRFEALLCTVYSTIDCIEVDGRRLGRQTETQLRISFLHFFLLLS